MRVSCPLEIMIALHYWTTPGPYSPECPEHANSPAVREACARMIKAGLLQFGETEQYTATESTRVFVQALCAVPWPVQEWVIPKQGD